MLYPQNTQQEFVIQGGRDRGRPKKLRVPSIEEEILRQADEISRTECTLNRIRDMLRIEFSSAKWSEGDDPAAEGTVVDLAKHNGAALDRIEIAAKHIEQELRRRRI